MYTLLIPGEIATVNGALLKDGKEIENKNRINRRNHKKHSTAIFYNYRIICIYTHAYIKYND